jgi:hypothetical protein
MSALAVSALGQRAVELPGVGTPGGAPQEKEEEEDEDGDGRNSRVSDRRWRWAIGLAIVWYCGWAILFIQAKPGFQYDEAIDVLGSVSLLHSHEELKLPHAPETWFCVAEHCFPLMSARYIGSVKEYLCLPLFAIFGPRAEVVRLLAMTLGALGIFGITTLLARQAGYAVAAVGAWVLALNPSYLDMTILDNSAFSPWMAAFGLLCISASAYMARQSARTAFWVGAAVGLGVWSRANYVWMLAALWAAIVISLGRRVFVHWPQWVGFVVGGLIGGSPFLAYQILSEGGTWQAVSMFGATGTLLQRFQHRLWMLSETVLSNGEHHRVWGGPVSLPVWQLWVFPLVVFASCVVCVFFRGLLARVAGLTFLFYFATFCYSSLPIGEHHLMTLVPIAVVVVVLAWQRMAPPHIAVPQLLIAVVYLASAIYWSSAALNGLRRTGGVGAWSDAIYPLTERLRADFPGREIKVLDWGLQNSVYVLSDGQVRTREIFWESNGPWIEQIRHGGAFLLNGPENRQIPATSIAFLRALAEGRPTMRRYTVPQRSGVAYAEVIDITPDTLGTGPVPPADPAVPTFQELRPSDPDFLKQAAGFYLLEQGGWRWTAREFSLMFPDSVAAKSITLHVNVPEAEMQKLGAITLSIRVGEHVLAPEAFSRAGDFEVTRALEAGWGNRFDFRVDKTLAPTAGDNRELGIIFVGARLDLR